MKPDECSSVSLALREPRKRPALVWAVTMYVLYGATVGYFGYVSTIAHPEMMPEGFRPYFERLSLGDGVLSGIVQISYLAATVALFRMDERAVRLWVIAFVISLAAAIYHVLFKDWGGVALVPYQKVGPFIALLLPAAVALYSYKLFKKK